MNTTSKVRLGVKEMNGYTRGAWKGINYDQSLSIKDIAKIIRTELKNVYPEATFSIITNGNYYTDIMYIYLMSDTRTPFNTTENAQKQNININQYYIKQDDRLNDYGKQMFQFIKDLCDSFNYNDSDGQIDYFDRGFYLHLHIGKYNKPFELKE